MADESKEKEVTYSIKVKDAPPFLITGDFDVSIGKDAVVLKDSEGKMVGLFALENLCCMLDAKHILPAG